MPSISKIQLEALIKGIPQPATRGSRILSSQEDSFSLDSLVGITQKSHGYRI